MTEATKPTATASSGVSDSMALLASGDREQRYSRQWDAYYYADTGEWAENKCSDSSCEFCAFRPNNAFDEANEKLRGAP